jgi:hypothetical protein
MDIDLNKRYQTMLVLWFALLMSVVMYLVLTRLVTPSINKDLDNSLRFIDLRFNGVGDGPRRNFVSGKKQAPRTLG